MRRAVPAAVLAGLALLAAPRPAVAADAFDAYRAALKRIDAEERTYWKGFERRFGTALDERATAIRDFHAGRGPLPDDPFATLRALFGEHERFDEARGQAAVDLAASGHAKAVPVLLDALLDAAAAAEAVDRVILASRPTRQGAVHEPEPSIERQGLATRMAGLASALGAVPDGPAGIVAALPRAAQGDGKDSVARRVALIDALATVPEGGIPEALAALRPLLAARESSIRVAALEAVARFGAAGRGDLVPLMKDANPLVRRALLGAVRARAAKDPAWIAPVLEAYEAARTQERAEGIATLVTLTRQGFGDDPAAWRAWKERHAGEFETGTFDVEKVAVDAATPKAPAGQFAFYGVRSSSDRVVFLVDGTACASVPSDLEFQRKRHMTEWVGGDRNWEKDGTYETVLATARREVGRALAALPAEGAFGLAMLRDATREAWPKMSDTSVLGLSGLLAPTEKNRRRAAETMADEPAAWGRAHPQEGGLLIAMALAGMPPDRSSDFPDPKADTVVLLGDGWIRGGRWLLPEHVVKAFERANRFRRLVAHTVRVSDEGKSAEALMKGLAEATGGTYVFVEKPPPR